MHVSWFNGGETNVVSECSGWCLVGLDAGGGGGGGGRLWGCLASHATCRATMQCAARAPPAPSPPLPARPVSCPSWPAKDVSCLPTQWLTLLVLPVPSACHPPPWQAYNCLDRHVKEGRGDEVCFYWEGNDVGQETVTTYGQLLDQVCQVG